ncbi:MAG: hypothetical protein HKN07_14805 [Acidimicrobiia bacterium]|nr:hypothetical protein [Acidimicrobiia bacterium]
MSERTTRTATAVSIVVLLLLTAVLSAWQLIGAFSASSDAASLGEPLAATAAAQPLAGPDSVRVTGALQLSQPRDPFRPLVTPGSPAAGLPGVSTGEDGTFDPGLSAITLIEVRLVNGVLRATVEVNGTTYDVGVGDTFAGSYLVVSLTEDSGVFTFGDTAFELGVGQQILK